ncbi:MAG TPA: SDR family oxidoreductase [Frankiaceae bacterium]|jgi:gluconate 5-dehydrogenase|nr:SDR family oxidoreductase [Frankiaceae bacterium]
MNDAFGLDGKPALVVGGGSGIGRATALLLASSGARVAVADLDGDRAATVAKEVEGVAIAGDVTDPEGAQRVVDEAHQALGGIQVMANIVGLAAWADIMSVDLATWEGDLRINLTQHLLVGRAVARHMIDDGVKGALALVTSISGIYGAPNHSAYGAAKAGATNLARSMANEWAPYGIRVNSVAPDVIATPRVVAGFEDRGVANMDSIVAEEALLGRWGRPEEIAGPLVFLLSDLAAFITGQNLIVDGGSNARFPHSGPKPFSED